MAVSSNAKKGGSEIGVVLAVFLVTNLASQIFQPPITYNNGQSFDGIFYTRMAYQISAGLEISTEGPFTYRIGTPFLAALFFKDHLLLGFKVVNIVANLLSTVLLIFWLRLFLADWRIRALLVTLFITAWHGTVRFTYYDPAYTDPWWFVFLLAGLIVIQRMKCLVENNPSPAGEGDRSGSKEKILLIIFMGVISFVGVIFREVALLLPLALVFITNPLSRIEVVLHPLANGNIAKILKRPFYLAVLPLVLGISATLLVHRLASQYNDYSFFTTALGWAYDKPALTYLHAFFITYGLLILIPLCFWRRTARFLGDNQHLLIYLIAVLVLSWVGGSDTEKFLWWAMPVVFLLIGMGISENPGVFKSPLLIVVLAASTMLSMRWFWVVPDYPNSFKTPYPILSILSNKFQYLDLWSFFAERTVEVRSFVEYLLLSGVIVLWIKRRAVAPTLSIEKD